MWHRVLSPHEGKIIFTPLGAIIGVVVGVLLPLAAGETSYRSERLGWVGKSCVVVNADVGSGGTDRYAALSATPGHRHPWLARHYGVVENLLQEGD